MQFPAETQKGKYVFHSIIIDFKFPYHFLKLILENWELFSATSKTFLKPNEMWLIGFKTHETSDPYNGRLKILRRKLMWFI